jgi:hypothetical protein
LQGKIPGEKRFQGGVRRRGRSVGRNRVIEAGPRSFNGEVGRLGPVGTVGVRVRIGDRGARFALAQSAGPVLTGEGGVTRDGPRVPVGRVVRMRGRFRKGGAVAARERVGLGRAGRGFYRQSVRVVAVIGFDLIDFA